MYSQATVSQTWRAVPFVIESSEKEDSGSKGMQRVDGNTLGLGLCDPSVPVGGSSLPAVRFLDPVFC